MTEPSVHAAGQGPPAVLIHRTFAGGPEINDLLRATWAVPEPGGRW